MPEFFYKTEGDRLPEHWHIWRRSPNGKAYFALSGSYAARASAQRRGKNEAIGRRCMILRCDQSPCPDEPAEKVKRG